MSLVAIQIILTINSLMPPTSSYAASVKLRRFHSSVLSNSFYFLLIASKNLLVVAQLGTLPLTMPEIDNLIVIRLRSIALSHFSNLS